MRPSGSISTSVSRKRSCLKTFYPQGTVKVVPPPIDWRDIQVASYHKRVRQLLASEMSTLLASSCYQVIPAIIHIELERRENLCPLPFAHRRKVTPKPAALSIFLGDSSSPRAHSYQFKVEQLAILYFISMRRRNSC